MRNLDDPYEPVRYFYYVPLHNVEVKVGARVNRGGHGIWQVTRTENGRAYGVHVDDLERSRLPEPVNIGGRDVFLQ